MTVVRYLPELSFICFAGGRLLLVVWFGVQLAHG
jgi:hypothetical protein